MRYRTVFLEGRQIFLKYHDAAYQIRLNQVSNNVVIEELDAIQVKLLKAFKELPALCTSEKKEAEDLLMHLALSWKEVGNALFNQGKYQESIDIYRKSIGICLLKEFSGKYLFKALPVYSNLVQAYAKLENYPKAIAIGQLALQAYEKCPEGAKSNKLHNKIVFNLAHALSAHAKNTLLLNNYKEARLAYQRANDLVAKHKGIFATVKNNPIKKDLNRMKNILDKVSDAPKAIRVETPSLRSICKVLTTLGQFTEKTKRKTRESHYQQTSLRSQ